ncbi:MAG: hypothetical protein OXC13_16150 [Caldilineaceae bacterium]|nr:hypothetical protein [Caldilineaceae bacterium]
MQSLPPLAQMVYFYAGGFQCRHPQQRLRVFGSHDDCSPDNLTHELNFSGGDVQHKVAAIS